MGSWNVTCGITQLPIRAGDRVAVIPLTVHQPDFLARDSLAGSGSTGNDIIAKPFALPVFGEYDDYGGVHLDEGQVGVQYADAVFQHLVKAGRLLVHPNGKPTAVDKVPKDVFSLLTRRALLLSVPNQRKAWLKNLHEMYAATPDDQKATLSHYAAQMEVDPDTLPDGLVFGLGVMYVPEALFLSLANAVGNEEAYGHYDRTEEKLVEFKGNRRGELENMVTLTDEGKKQLAKMDEMLAMPDNSLDDKDKAYIRELVPRSLLRHAQEVSQECTFFPQSVFAALNDIAVHGNAEARALWVNFMLFQSAMIGMRKHWTPQTGAGSSCGLYETHHLYKAANEFVSQSLTRYYAEAAADADE